MDRSDTDLQPACRFVGADCLAIYCVRIELGNFQTFSQLADTYRRQAFAFWEFATHPVHRNGYGIWTLILRIASTFYSGNPQFSVLPAGPMNRRQGLVRLLVGINHDFFD
jgi:hypothetical protein